MKHLTECLDCPSGWTTSGDISSARCQGCEQGTFELDGSCVDCPSGWKRATKDDDRTKCVACDSGQTTAKKIGATIR